MTLVCLVGLLLAVLAGLLTSDLEVVVDRGTPFFLLLAFWIVLLTTPYRIAKKQMKTNMALFGPIKYIFSSLGMNHSGLHFSSDVAYQGLWAVAETKSLYLLYYGEGSAFLVPKRFFRDAGQQNDWRILIEQGISPKGIEKPGFLARWL